MSKVSLAGNVSGTGIFTIASPNSNTDRTLTLPDASGTVLTTGSTAAVTQSMLASNVVGNGPAFSASKTGGSQSYTSGVTTKVTITVEVFDTNSNYDTSTSRFTPTVAGYYQVNASIAHNFNGANGSQCQTYLYKNGSSVQTASIIDNSSGGPYGSIGVSTLLYMNGSTDYLEVYGYSTNGSPVFQADNGTFFQASLVRAA